MRVKFFLKAAALGFGALLLGAAHSSATILFNASGTAAGVAASAAASFTIAGDTLTVTLRNTSASHAPGVHDVPGSTLTGVLFDLTGNPTLVPVSALIAAGAILQGNKCNAGACTAATTDVGGEWGYAAGDFAGGADRAIASAGYLTTGLARNIGNFEGGAAGTDLDSPKSLGGINFGIVSAADGFTPNGGLAKVPLIADGVTFVLSGVEGLGEADISDVSFQYGTSWSETNVSAVPDIVCTACGMPRDNEGPVPEPATLALLATGLAALAHVRRRRTFATRA